MNENICFKIEAEVLYLEQVLVELDFPVMYTCLDRNLVRYLVLCVDYEELKYMVIKVNNDFLIKILTQKMPMRDIFVLSKEVFLITSADDFENDKIEKKSGTRLDEDDLPLKDAFFEIMNDEITEFIKNIEEEKHVFIFRQSIQQRFIIPLKYYFKKVFEVNNTYNILIKYDILESYIQITKPKQIHKVVNYTYKTNLCSDITVLTIKNERNIDLPCLKI